jgi:AcrR family transcriptional regulator
VSEITESGPRGAAGRRLAGAVAAVGRHRHGRVPRELRERQLLELAGELFGERGYAAASMDELARRAGVSKPVIYGLFGSKEGLLLACAEELGRELTESVLAAIAGRSSPEELLRAGGQAFFAFVRERQGLWQATFATIGTLPGAGAPTGGEENPLEAKLLEIRARQDEIVRAMILAAGDELGAQIEPLRAEAFARGLNGMFEGLAAWAAERPEVGPEQLAEWVVEMTIPGLERLAAS